MAESSGEFSLEMKGQAHDRAPLTVGRIERAKAKRRDVPQGHLATLKGEVDERL